MLHVFAVNQGHLMTFDVNLAMDKVIKLKKAIEQSCHILLHKQVLLVKGGQAMDDDKKVCEYSAGTESNPFFMFDMSAVESGLLNRSSTPKLTDDFIADIQSSAQLPPTYSSIVHRTKLAIRIKEATLCQVSTLKSLIRDELLMFEGWQAAFANLEIVLEFFQQRAVNLHKQCSNIFQVIDIQDTILEEFDDTISLLKRIPLLKSLLGEGDKTYSSDCSLLEWIEMKYRGPELQQLVMACRQQMALLTPEKLTRLLNESKQVCEIARNPTKRDESRAKEILAAQKELLAAAEREASYQVSLAQGFVKNQENARHLNEISTNHDPMVTLCESHVTQLSKMHDVELTTRKGYRKCFQQKKYLMQTFHASLTWLYGIEKKISKCDRDLSLFHDRLVQFQHNVSFLFAVKDAPKAYIYFLVESARRPKFAHAFTQWTDNVVSATCVAREREVNKRRLFKKNLSGHFIAKLFPGFGDKPPSIANRPMRKFDINIPTVSHDDILRIVKAAPQLKDFYNEADLIGNQLAMQQSLPIPCNYLASDSMRETVSPLDVSSFAQSPPVVVSGKELTCSSDDIAISLESPPGDNSASMRDFFTMPAPLAESHSFIPISPPNKSTAALERQVYSYISSDDDIFHSINNDVKNVNDVNSLYEEELKRRDEKLLKMKMKYQENLSHLLSEKQQLLIGQDDKLANLISQLEEERKERRRAWETENSTAKKLQEINEKLAEAQKENTHLLTEMSVKNEQISDLHAENARHKDDCAMKVANEEEKLATDKWNAEEKFKKEKKKWMEATDKLRRELDSRAEELAAMEDHVQDLEKQLSEEEAAISTLNITVATCKAEVEICQNEVFTYKVKMKEAEESVSLSEGRRKSVEQELDKTREKMTDLKSMLAGYEVELQEAEEKSRELKETKLELAELRIVNNRLSGLVQDSNLAQRDLEQQIVAANEEVTRIKTLLSGSDNALKIKVESIEEQHENEVLLVKQEAEKNLKTMFEENKRKMTDVLSQHQDEVRTLKENHYWEIEELKKTHSAAMDELRADLLNDVYRANADAALLHNEFILQKEKLSRNPDQFSPRMSSSEIISSKLPRSDDVMMASLKEEVEKEKEALTWSFKKREESATKRRQVLFNSAIQHIVSSKDAEIARLKNQLSESQINLSSSSICASSIDSTKQRGRDVIVMSNFQPDDRVLVTYDPRHRYHVLLTLGKTLHFVHTSHTDTLKLPSKPEDGDEKAYLPARVMSKQYCMAKKDSNRFGVPVDTKFYRVKVTLLPASPT